MAIVRRSNNARGLKTKYLKIFLWEGKWILFEDYEWKDFSQESYGFSVSKFLSVLPWTSFLGPGSTAANNGYMSVPTNSYNNNSQNGSDVRLISSTPSMTDSRQGSTFSIVFFQNRPIFSRSKIDFQKNDILIIDRFFFWNFLSNPKRKKFSPFVKWATLILLFIVNLLNYMDRFTIVGVLSAVQQEFDIGQTKAALLQTVFLVSYMALSPIVGYLGKPHMQWLIAHFWIGFGLDFEIFRYR